MKAEAIETAANAPAVASSQSSGLPLRKRLGSCKAEAVEATQSQVEESQASIASPVVRRSRRSRR